MSKARDATKHPTTHSTSLHSKEHANSARCFLDMSSHQSLAWYSASPVYARHWNNIMIWNKLLTLDGPERMSFSEMVTCMELLGTNTALNGQSTCGESPDYLLAQWQWFHCHFWLASRHFSALNLQFQSEFPGNITYSMLQSYLLATWNLKIKNM